MRLPCISQLFILCMKIIYTIAYACAPFHAMILYTSYRKCAYNKILVGSILH